MVVALNVNNSRSLIKYKISLVLLIIKFIRQMPLFIQIQTQTTSLFILL